MLELQALAEWLKGSTSLRDVNLETNFLGAEVAQARTTKWGSCAMVVR